MPVNTASTRESPDPTSPAASAEERLRAGQDQLRAGTWRVLGRLLADIPRDDILEPLRSVEPDESAGSTGPLAASWELLAAAARSADPEALDDEYHALFIGIGRGELVPYGSWYRTGFLMEKPLAELRGELQQLGFAPREGVKEPEDHAGALCEVMSALAEEDAALGTGPGAAQRGFFVRHIEPWMGRLFSDMQQASSARFYRAVGQLGEEFLRFESQYLAMPE